MHQKAAEAAKTRRLWILEKGGTVENQMRYWWFWGKKLRIKTFLLQRNHESFGRDEKQDSTGQIPMKRVEKNQAWQRLAFSWRYLPNSAVAQESFKTKLKSPWKSRVEFSTISLLSAKIRAEKLPGGFLWIYESISWKPWVATATCPTLKANSIKDKLERIPAASNRQHSLNHQLSP